MREVVPGLLWLGHAGDVQDLRAVLDKGVAALVDLAINEQHPPLTRELTYCRFPLLDGHGNPPELLRVAVDCTAALLGGAIPTLVCCSAGMSRSLAIAAAAWAKLRHRAPDEILREFAATGPHDLSPSLWNDVLAACFPSVDSSG